MTRFLVVALAAFVGNCAGALFVWYVKELRFSARCKEFRKRVEMFRDIKAFVIEKKLEVVTGEEEAGA